MIGEQSEFPLRGETSVGTVIIISSLKKADSIYRFFNMTVDLSSLPDFPDDVPTCPLVVIDYAKLQANDKAEKDALWNACTTIGFFYLKNHDIDVEPMWEVGQKTLELPQEEKSKFERPNTGRTPRFKGIGKGIVDEKGTGDTLEFYNIWKDDALKYPEISSNEYPPPIMEGMPQIKRFIEDSEKITRAIIETLNEYLELPPGSLLERHKYELDTFSECRILRNPAYVDNSKVSLVPHTDFGSVSTVYHKKLGGLQVYDLRNNDWKYVKPLEEHVVCNIGDALAIYSGGILRSSLHRVVPPPGEQAKYVRWSLVYFLRPHSSAIMGALTESPMIAKAVEENPMPHIPPNTTNGEWVKRRVLAFRTENYKGTQSWESSRGTEPIKT